MSENKFVKVGKIHSAQGIKGEVFVYLFAQEATWLAKLKTLNLSSADGEQPEREWAIDHKRVHRKTGKLGLAIKLIDIKDRNQAEALVGQSVYVPADFLISQKGEKIFLGEILDFKVIDKSRGEVGRIVDFADNTAQDLIVIANSQGQRFEVPLVEPILIKIDFALEQVIMDIPLGLVAGEEL